MLTQVACPACGAANRIVPGKDMAQGKCGACAAPLRLAEPIGTDDKSFDRHLSATKGPVIVDIWAPWCGPCRLMAPNFEAAARELAGKVRFLKLNADDSAAASRLGVRSIPTLILFDDGREVARQMGLMSSAGISTWARTHMRAPAAQS